MYIDPFNVDFKKGNIEGNMDIISFFLAYQPNE